MEDIVIPMSLGNMEDIGQDSNMLPEVWIASLSQPVVAIQLAFLKTLKRYMREKKGKLPAQHSGVISALFSLFSISFRIVVDYSNLPDKYKNLLVSDEIRREGDLLERRVNELIHTVQHNKAPNMRVRCFFLHFSVINFLLCSSLGCGKIRLGRRKTTRDQHRVWKDSRQNQESSTGIWKSKTRALWSLYVLFEHDLNKIDGIYNVSLNH